MTTNAIRRAGSVSLCLSLVVFAFATLYTGHRGQLAMTESDQCFHEGELLESVRHARRAATLSVPGALYVSRAYDRLGAIARGAEIARNKELATTAWRAIRASAIETSNVWANKEKELSAANAALRRFSVTKSDGAKSSAPSIRIGGAGALAGSFLLSLVAGAWTIGSGLSETGRFTRRKATIPGALAIAGAVAWGWALLFT